MNSFLRITMLLVLIPATHVLQAKEASINCPGKSLAVEVGNPDAVVANNTFDGIVLFASSSAQVRTPVNDNGGAGLSIGPLSYAQVFGSSYSNNGGGDINCTHFTAYARPFGTCPTPVEDLVALLSGVSRGGDPETGVDTLTFNGMNVQIVNGAGSTDSSTGTGNLIIGYNEARNDGSDDRSGSHMLVQGRENNYSSYGGLVSGETNSAEAPWSSVIGGSRNVAASGTDFNGSPTHGGIVIGGEDNVATGTRSVALGGDLNTTSADAPKSVIMGGRLNSGEFGNSVIAGGRENATRSFAASILGGRGNIAGDGNPATARYSSISGGRDNSVLADYASVAGGRFNSAEGLASSISGGNGTTALNADEHPDTHTP